MHYLRQGNSLSNRGIRRRTLRAWSFIATTSSGLTLKFIEPPSKDGGSTFTGGGQIQVWIYPFQTILLLRFQTCYPGEYILYCSGTGISPSHILNLLFIH